MAKKAYIGVDGVARKIKKGYIGIDGVARKIKKAYIGVGGVARPCWSGGELTYYGKISMYQSSDVSQGVSAVRVGDYALFAGGVSISYFANKDVISLDKNYTKQALEKLTNERGYMGTATVGNYGIFVGGWSGSSVTSIVDCYDANLTKTKVSNYIQQSTRNLAGASVGNYALFNGGYTNDTDYSVKVQPGVKKTYAYDINLTLTTPTETSIGHMLHTGVSTKSYALFAGGIIDSHPFTTPVVNTYNANLTMGSTSSGLSGGYINYATANVGDYALFAGGFDGASYSYSYNMYETKNPSKVVTAYNDALTRSVPVALSASRYYHKGGSLENCALFVGGYYNGTSTLTKTAEKYDGELVRSETPSADLNTSFFMETSVSVGDSAFFCQRIAGSAGYDVHIYTLM